MYVYTMGRGAAVGEITFKHHVIMCRPKSSSRKRSLLYIGVGWADTTNANIIYNNNIEVVSRLR